MTNAISGIGYESALADKIKNQTAQQAATTTSVGATTSTSSTTSTTSNSNVSNLNSTIATKQQEIDDASELQTKNDKEIEKLEAEVKELQAQVVQAMEKAVNDGQAFSEEQQTNINNAVTQTVAAYLNGEITKDQLMETMSSKLSVTESEMASKLSELMEAGDPLVAEIESKISQICDLASQNDELAKKIKDAAASIDAAQKEAAGSGCCDPIGFKQDGVTYDFIVDRDNDGEFDGEQEFLGAQNGFEEMKAFDKDGNGVVEGDELEGVKMIKTNKKAGTQSFVSAKEAGVNSIDLASYQAKNKDIGNGNTLAGNYNLNVNGKSIKGYQTLDNVDWLRANYGNSYGKSINSTEAHTINKEGAAANTKAEEVKTTAEKTTSKAVEHKSLKDFKNLNADAEKALVANTTETVDGTLITGIEANQYAYTSTVDGLKDEKERDAELGINQEKDDKKADNTQQKPNTLSFMTMAYSMQAEDANKKKEVA